MSSDQSALSVNNAQSNPVALGGVGSRLSGWGELSGVENAPDEGLTYLRARTYSASTGRFISRDMYLGSPGRPGTLHKYAYGENNPMSNLDPSGRMSLMSVGVGIGVAQRCQLLQRSIPLQTCSAEDLEASLGDLPLQTQSFCRNSMLELKDHRLSRPLHRHRLPLLSTGTIQFPSIFVATKSKRSLNWSRKITIYFTHSLVRFS